MQDESVYGLVYKAIREERVFTQKEAAGTAVTPHFLRQFEQRKSRITIQKFEEILSNIGIDKETFDSLKTQMFPTEFHKLQALPLIRYSKKQTEYHSIRTSDYYIACLRTAIKHYSVNGYYDKAENLAMKTLEVINAFPLLSTKMIEIINISMERANNFLRQDDIRGLELAKHIFASLNNFEKIYPNQLLTRMREDFFVTVTQLNHTGQPLDV